MNLDELHTAWNRHHAAFRGTLHLDRDAAAAVLHARASASLTRQRMWLWLETTTLAAVLIALVVFASGHTGHAPLLVCAALLVAGGAALLASAARQLQLLAGVDHAWPVIRLQKRLDHVAILQIKTSAWAVVLGTTLWLPALAVLLRAALGLDLFATDDPGVWAWIAANIAFGLGVFAAAVWVARRAGDRFQRWPRLARLTLDLSGHNLRQARASLAQLEASLRLTGAQEPPPHPPLA